MERWPVRDRCTGPYVAFTIPGLLLVQQLCVVLANDLTRGLNGWTVMNEANSDSQMPKANLNGDGLFDLLLFAALSCFAVPITVINLLWKGGPFSQLISVVALFGESVAVWFLSSGLSELSKTNPHDFRSPAKFAKLLLPGLPAVLLGYIVLLAWARFTAPALLILGEVIFLGGVIAGLAGALGALRGLWRVGLAFDNNLVKAGSITLLLPAVDVAAVFLLLVGMLEIRGSQIAGGRWNSERKGTSAGSNAVSESLDHLQGNRLFCV